MFIQKEERCVVIFMGYQIGSICKNIQESNINNKQTTKRLVTIPNPLKTIQFCYVLYKFQIIDPHLTSQNILRSDCPAIG